MKLLLENWRKLSEGDVIDFPTPTGTKDVQKVIKLEADIAALLGDIYGNQYSIPVDVIENLETLLDAVEITIK